MSTSDTSTPPVTPSYRYENFDGFAVITLLPALNKVPWDDIESIGTNLLAQMESKNTPRFLIDLEALTHMGSAMVALVVRLWKSVKERNGKMAVVNNDENVIEVFKLAGLAKVWTIVDSRDAGYAALGVSEKNMRSQGLTPTPGYERDTEPGGGTGAAVLSLILLLTAVAGLFLLLKPQDFIKDQRVTFGLLFGGCILGLIASTATAMSAAGVKRGFGVLAVLASLGILGAGVVNTPQLKAMFDASPEKKGKSNKNADGSHKTGKTDDGAKSNNAATTGEIDGPVAAKPPLSAAGMNDLPGTNVVPVMPPGDMPPPPIINDPSRNTPAGKTPAKATPAKSTPGNTTPPKSTPKTISPKTATPKPITGDSAKKPEPKKATPPK